MGQLLTLSTTRTLKGSRLTNLRSGKQTRIEEELLGSCTRGHLCVTRRIKEARSAYEGGMLVGGRDEAGGEEGALRMRVEGWRGVGERTGVAWMCVRSSKRVRREAELMKERRQWFGRDDCHCSS